MAIYYFHVGIKGRGGGKSPRVVASAAYKSAARLIEKIYDPESGITAEIVHDYTKKNGVVFSEIFLPNEAPQRFKSAEVLWNEVVASEKRKDAQFCRDFTIALPKEFNSQQNIELVKEYVGKVFTERGIIAHASIHMDDENNPHVHIMTTQREVNPNGFGNKNRDWILSEAKLMERESWANITNQHLAKYGFVERITHLSYKDRGLDISPTIHEGYYARKVEEKGGIAEVCEINRNIKSHNINKALKNPLEFLEAKFFNRVTFTEAELEKTVFELTEGESNRYNQVLNKIKECKDVVKLKHNDLRGNVRFSFKTYVENEKRLFDHAIKLADSKFARKNEIGFTDILSKCKQEYQASDEQARVVANIISQNKKLDLIIGRAGTGKTSKVLKPISDYYKEKGYRVSGISLAGIVAETLRNDLKINSYTIHSWLKSLEQKPLTKKDVVILDEAGMVDVELMLKVIEKVKNSGAKLVSAGDHGQLPPIGRGAAFRGLIENIDAHTVSKVYRQREEWQQSATEALASWNIEKAMLAYADAKYIIWSDKKEESIASLARDYVENFGKQQITTSFKNADIKELNQSIRELLIIRGDLRSGRTYKFGSLNKEFRVGERIIFKQNEYEKYNIRNGTRGEIIKLDTEGISVKLSGEDRVVEVNLKEYDKIDYAYALTIHAIQGLGEEKVMVLASRGFNSNLAYVGFSRFKESMRIYADKENLKDLVGLTNIMSRDGGSELVSDYRGRVGEKANNIVNYMVYAEEARNLSNEINKWCAEEDSECFEHEKWHDLKEEALSKRKEYAQLIANDFSAHRVYIKQAGLYQNTIKAHAGLKKLGLSDAEKREYEDLVRYKSLLEQKGRGEVEERNKLADSILRARIGNQNLYQTWASELELEPQKLYKHALSYAAKEHQSSELFAKTFAKLEKLHFGSKLSEENIRSELYNLYEDIKLHRDIRQSSLQTIDDFNSKIEQENKDIVKLENEISDRELYLKRTFVDEKIIDQIDKLGSGKVSETLKSLQLKKGYEISEALSHVETRDLLKRSVELGSEMIDQYKKDANYQKALLSFKESTHKLGRFINDFDFKQIENTVNAAQKLSGEYEKALSVFSDFILHEKLTDQNGNLKEDAIFRDLLVEKSAKEIVRIENEALRSGLYQGLLEIVNNSNRKNSFDSDLEEISEQICDEYDKAKKWIDAYKCLIAEDKKYVSKSSEEINTHKKLQELIIGHRAALKEVFSHYKPYQIKASEKEDLLALGLHKARSLKSYIKANTMDKERARKESNNKKEVLKDIDLSIITKGTKISSKKEWKEYYAIERIATHRIYDGLYHSLPTLLPEFGFRRRGNGYISTTAQKADGSCGKKVGKVYVYDNNPGMLIDYTRGSVSIWDYIKDNHMPCASKKEVMEYLLEQAGLKEKVQRVATPKLTSKPIHEKLAKQPKVDSKLLEAVVCYAKEQLISSKNPVLDYLTKARGYKTQDIKAMELGYIADKKHLGEYLKTQGFNYQKIKEANRITHMIGKSHNLVIPFKGINGKVIGLAGRDIYHTQASMYGKYLYSKELSRSSTLLNIHKIKNEDHVVIVEGMLDALHADSKGIKGVVGLGGTSLNEEQIKLLSEAKVKSITLCLDNDNAGLEAGMKIIGKLKASAPEIEIRYAKLPESIKDPDQLIRENGSDAFKQVVRDAETVKSSLTLSEIKYAESLQEVISRKVIIERGILNDNRLNISEDIGEMILKYRTLYKSYKEYEGCFQLIEENEKLGNTFEVGLFYKKQEQIERSGDLEKFKELKGKILPNIKHLPSELRNAYDYPEKEIDQELFKAQVQDIKEAHILAAQKDLQKFEILDTQIKHAQGLAENFKEVSQELNKTTELSGLLQSEIEEILADVKGGIKESLSDTKLAERQLEGKVYEALLETLQKEVKLKGKAVLGIKNKLRVKASEALNRTITNLQEVVKLKENLDKQFKLKNLLSRDLSAIQNQQSKYDLTKKHELYNHLNTSLEGRFINLNQEQKTRYILAGGGKEHNPAITKHKIFMNNEGKNLVDKIQLEKEQHHYDWTKEPNIDKIMNKNLNQANDLDNTMVENITKSKSLKL